MTDLERSLPPGYAIRLARPSDLPMLPVIEKHAAEIFAGYGLAELFRRVLTPYAALERGQKDGLLWVAVDHGDHPVGFALACEVGINAHLDELDVDPRHGRRGLGRALVETVCDWAGRAGYPAITLTTLSHIPWNAPFYEKLGFRSLEPEALTPHLRELLQTETAHGLPAENRVAMRKWLRKNWNH
jgi:GNAT superfamily N-acetyltransferase